MATRVELTCGHAITYAPSPSPPRVGDLITCGRCGRSVAVTVAKQVAVQGKPR